MLKLPVILHENIFIYFTEANIYNTLPLELREIENIFIRWTPSSWKPSFNNMFLLVF